MKKFTFTFTLFLMATAVMMGQLHRNLLNNPGATAGDLSGWGIGANDGDGWGVTPDLGIGGSPCFQTSYGWCIKQTTIDLVERGYDPAWLDTAPIVLFSDFMRSGESGIADDTYYLTIHLLDGNGNLLAQFGTGDIATEADWQQIKGSFKDYGPGLRRILWEHGGHDNEGWAGHFGAYIDASYLSIGNHMYYSGGQTGDLAGWDVTENGGDGWGLVDPGNAYGYTMYTTSHGWCAKSQTIDLMEYGYTAQELNQQPLITAWNWVLGLPDNYADRAELTVRLLDENMDVLDEYYSEPFYCSDQWEKLEATFTDYGPGLRYIYFEHAGWDAEVWAGHYGSVFDDAELNIDWDQLSTPVRESIDNAAELTISPNPSDGRFTVSWDATGIGETSIIVSSLTGKQVYQHVADQNGMAEIDLGEIPDGVYLVQIRSGQGVATKRVVIN